MVRDGDDMQRQEKEVRLDGLGVRWEMGEICYIPLIVLQFKVVSKKVYHC